METGSFLITGGCGMQGSHVVEKLLAQYPQSRITVISRSPTTNLYPGVQYHQADITNPEDLRKVFDVCRPTVVFHCAAATGTKLDTLPDAVVRAINVEGTRYLLEQSKRSKVRAFVYTSSPSVVQKRGFEDLKNVDETLPTVVEGDDSTLYTITKAEGERLTSASDNPSGMRTTSLRPSMIYGERSDDIIPSCMAMLRAKRHTTQIGDNTNMVNPTYAGNSADAHLQAALKLLNAPNGVAGEAFNITDGRDIRFWDFNKLVYKTAGQEVDSKAIRVIGSYAAGWLAWAFEWAAWVMGTKPLMKVDWVGFMTMYRTFSIEKARTRLGYEPEVSMEEGVRRSVEWFLKNEKGV